MTIDINNRGNGVCPRCAYWNNCTYHAILRDSLAPKGYAKKNGMEIVIYTCPHFKEK
jgi:hypothetical protein